MSIHEKFAQLRALYPDDIDRIEAEEAETKRLMERREFASMPVTQDLLAMCRSQVIECRLKLATNRHLSEEARRELWAVIDARMWFVELVAKDYQGELGQVEQMVEAELSRFP